MNNGLLELIHPLDHTEFLNHFKLNKPFVIHHIPNELNELRKLPFLESLDVLLDSWSSHVQVHLPDLRDEVSAIDVPTNEAINYFNQGMALLFNDVNTISPVLENWLNQMKSDLGISSRSYGRCLVYAIPDGKGTAAHFDQNINFVLQIHGTKKWTLANNNSVMNPMDRFTMGQPVDPEMMSYLDSPMAETMPEETYSFELKPGSLLFVPRGVWHATHADGDAISLNFTFTAPAWMDLFLGALRSRLILSTEWRETALIADEKKFDSLLNSLIHDLPHWNAPDILGAIES
jgi:50S ribosomal protein L16 3-hydroxylase